MVLSVKHFDVRLKQWVHTDNDTNNPDSILKDKLENTELEYFFPDKSFSATYIDEKITDEQLKNNHPDGHVLLLAQGTRLTYGLPECLPIIERIYPDSKDRAAYNILTSPCENSLIKTVNILVVDDANGENGGIIDNNQAYGMTGDGYGQITTKLYQELVGHQEEDEYALLQHRLCWKEGSGDDPYDRTAKGTFRPENLNGKTVFFDKELTYQDENNKPTIDIIIPVSSFKGSDKDNPLGATKAQIKPGLYTQEIWLGGKTLSELTETAISQPIASFPKGIKDLAEQVELEAKKLKEIASDPRKTAEYYCEKHEKRKSFLKQQALELEEQGTSDPEAAEKLAKLNAQIQTESSIYKLIKKDLQGHGQLLETEKVKGELSRFLQNEWKDTSIGKNLSFERAMVIPSKNLQDGEVFIPHYKEGQLVPNFRSPFLNSNGMCVSTNKMVRDVLGPDGKPLKGVVAVSDETSEKIYNRLCKQIQEFIPALEQQNAKPEGIEEIFNQNQKFKLEASTKEEYKQKIKEKIDFTDKFNQYITKLQELGYKINPLPRESEQERQARDYDGDTIGFELADKYPNLTAEAIERNLPQNAYDPTIKFKKQSFYEQDGSQPEFEKIAIHMADEISVGVINNHLTKVEALESEITILLKYGEEKDQLEYVQKVANYYEKIPDQDIPDQYFDYLKKFVDIVQNEPLTQESALRAMALNQLMYREMIAEATFENQIAVDMKKSSRKPDVEIIEANEKVLHRDVNYIKDKKKGDVYIDQGIQPTGNSPVEILVSKVNQYFETSKLESRELTQFSKLFKGVDYTHQQYLQATLAKREYDKEFNNAARLSRRRETEKGPSASIDISGGKTLDVTNILKYNHPQIWNAQKIKLRVSPVDPGKRGSGGHKYRVYAQINDELEDGKPKFRTLGTISKEQEWKLEELGVQPGAEITSTKISLKPGLSEAQVKLAFQKASEIAQNFRSAIPDDQKLAMAAATYALSSTRESFGSSKTQAKSEVEQEIEKQKKVSNFVFTVFSDEIENQLEKLQFNDFVLTGYKYNLENEASEPKNLGQVQEVRFNISEQVNKAGNSIVKDVIEVKDPETGEYKTFANINANDNKLPIGTTAIGIIEKGEVYTATVTTKVPGQPEVTFTVKELQKFQAHDQIFNGEKVNLTIACNKLEREDYVVYFQNGAKEEKLGTIAEESLKNGIKEGWLAEKPGQSGQKLQLQLNSISTGDNAFVIGRTPEGNLLRINVEKKLQNKEFKNQQVSARVNAYDKLYVYTAKIGDVSLGVIGQHHERIQRDLEKKTGRQSSSRSNTLSQPEKLIQAGVIKENQFQTTIPVIINSNDGTCKLTIDPESVQYPETWVKRHQLVEKQKEVSPAEQKNNQLFDKITERPSILFQSRRDKSEGLVRLAVDSKKAKATEKFLESSGIKYEILPQSQAKLEARKGMTVFMLDESTITPEKKEQIIQRTGSIKDSTIPPKPIPVVREQTLYFKDPNQEYTLPDGKKEIREGIGIVVPLQDAKALSEWLESKNLNSGYLQQDNIAIFGVEKSEINDKLQRYLNRTLGKPIDITTASGFKKYESFHQEINLKIETASLIKPDFVAPKSEYSKILQSLPNRAKKLNQEEAPLPMAPAKPLEVDSDIKNAEAEVLSNQTLSGVATITFKGIANENNMATTGVEITTTDNNGYIHTRSIGEYLGNATAPEAEYKAAIFSMKTAQELGITDIKLEGSSQTIIYQLQGKYSVKADNLKQLNQEAKELLDKFNSFEINLVDAQNTKNAKLTAELILKQEIRKEQVENNKAPIDYSKLNEQQKVALDKMLAFTEQAKSGNPKDNEFLLTGFAGTGKTYVIQQLLKALQSEKKICFTAPTNNAVKVLSEMAKSQGLEADAKTTHSLLGLKEQIDPETGEAFFAPDPKNKPKYRQYDIIVVDEASMLNSKLYEELKTIQQQGILVIYMGDEAQLPPVGEAESPVFKIENSAKLTEVMRYGGEIGKVVQNIRDNLDNNNPSRIQTSQDGSLVEISKADLKDTLVKLFTSEEFKEDNSSVKVIAYTNRRVDQLNELIKNELFGKDSEEYAPGMRLIARDAIVTGDKIILNTAEELTINTAVKIKENGYNAWVIESTNESGELVTFKTLANDSKDRFKKDVDTLFKTEGSKPKGERDYFSVISYKNQYGNVRPAYAITAHNSQGKTIKLGVVDDNNIGYRLKMALDEENPTKRAQGIKEHNQLRYVAMTRFQNKIHVLGDERQREISNQTQTNEPVKLPSASLANSTKAIEILGKVSEEKVQQLRSHLETHFKPLLENDKSNYSPGRQVAWVGAKWDLKEKDFKPGVQDDKLMELVKQVYPNANIVLVAYSKDLGVGINYHRDDSYAAIEARSINIGNSEWGYRAAKEQMAWTKEENTSAPYQEFKLESGTVTRFNCKNEHAALNTEAGRWSINIWSIKNDLGKENSVRQKFDNFIASNQEARAIVQSSVDLTIKSNEWTPGGEIKVEREYSSQKEATRNTLLNPKQLTLEELIIIGNQTAARAANPQIPDNLAISGKPIPMNYALHNYGDPPQVPVSTTIDAMRGYGRVHTTRGVDYQKAYGIKEGNIAIAVGKNNEQVAFRVGKQYQITEQMIKDPAYQQAWANWEKHSPKELTQSQANKEKIYGLFIEPLGDYVNGKIVPFPPIQQHETNNTNTAVADKKEWARYAPEGKQAYEVSSVGDSRFSALNAKLKDGRTIEEAYQLDVKGYRQSGNDWRLGKGKPPLNPISKEELYQAYKALWQEWAKENPQLIQELAEKSKGQVLTDRFANTEISQARALAEILNERQQSQLPNPLANLKPLNPAVAEHMKKDVAMAEVATQFIGKTAAPSETPSSTRNYAEAWGERANTGTYTKEDIIMVSGSGPWRGVTESQIQQTFKQHYIPLLDKAIEAQSTFVVGGAKGTDQLVQAYLKEKGYKLEQTNKGYTIATPIEKLIDTSTPSSNASQVPQHVTTTKEIAPGINLTSRSPDPLGAVLTSTTVKSRNAGAIANDYPVSFRDNKEMPAGNYGPETYTEAKPAGQPFLSAEQAFFAYKESLPLNEPRVQLMAEIQQAKFEQYPQIMQAVTERGGTEWLKQCSYLVSSGKPNFWEGKGLESPYIRALTQGYTKALEKTNSLATENQPEQPVKSTNQKPSQQETPISENKNDNLNTEIKQALSNPSSRRQDSIDSTLDAIKQSTIQNLQHWYEAAQKLGRTEKYLNRIQEVTNQYTQDSSYNLEKAFKAMSQDIKELQQINETTKLAQNIVKVLGKTDINGIMSVKTENYKSYQIAARLEDNTYIIKDKDDKVLLFLKDGKIKANNLTEEVINDLRFMNLRIENRLQNVKRELIER